MKFKATKEIYLNTELGHITKFLISDVYAHSLQWLCGEGEREGEGTVFLRLFYVVLIIWAIRLLKIILTMYC